MGKYALPVEDNLKQGGQSEREEKEKNKKEEEKEKENSFHFLPVWGIILYIFRLS